MEKSYIRFLIVFVGCLYMSMDSCVVSGFVVNDIGTIEALIANHKAMKKAEDKALAGMTLETGESELTTEQTSKYKQVRDVLNKRMGQVKMSVSLATDLVATSADLFELISDYAKFTSKTFEIAKSKPYVMIYYVNAVSRVADEVEHLTVMISKFALAEGNVLKATNQEKYQLLGMIRNTIWQMKIILTAARNKIYNYQKFVRVVLDIVDFSKQILNDESLNKAISSWKTNSANYGK